MEIEQVQDQMRIVQARIQAACLLFETVTGCTIHSIPVSHTSEGVIIGFTAQVPEAKKA